jgi:branched-chain amino acid aminotransferase
VALIPLDDRDGVIWLDGKLVPWREARVHVLTHALHYGGAAFEGERAYNGKVFKMTEHHERLVRSCRLLDYECPYGVEELNRAAEEVLAANKLVNAYVRPIVWRGSDNLGVSGKGIRLHCSVAAWEWPAYYPEEVKRRGLKLVTSSWARPAPDSAPCASKASGLYMICTMSRDAANRAGFDDALMPDYRGQLAETSASNIFLVLNGEIHTPTPDCFLDGITRRTTMDLARKRGVKVVERAMWPDEMEKAGEFFVTGTAVEVMPVGQVDQRRFDVGPITRQLMQDYHDLVNAR